MAHISVADHHCRLGDIDLFVLQQQHGRLQALITQVFKGREPKNLSKTSMQLIPVQSDRISQRHYIRRIFQIMDKQLGGLVNAFRI